MRAVLVAARLFGAALRLRLATTATLIVAALWLRCPATTRLRRLTAALRLRLIAALWLRLRLGLWLCPGLLLVSAVTATAPPPPALVAFTR